MYQKASLTDAIIFVKGGEFYGEEKLESVY